MELTILHTNDIHSNYENFSKVVNKIRELRDQNTLLLDAGDFADFKRIELLGTDGLAALDLLEYAGYDAICVGNNETFRGRETLSRMATRSLVPFLSCNLYSFGFTEIEGVKKSIIVNKNGLKILIIGVSPDLGVFYSLNNLETKDYMSEIKEEIWLNMGQFDLCVVLSHMGLNHDKKIAEEIDDVDIIIGGHLHILMDSPEIINNKIIYTSGCFGENVGLLKIRVRNRRARLLEAKNISIQDSDFNNDVINILKINKEKALDKLGTPLYNIDADLWHDIIEENPITNLLADALADIFQCDLGIINSGVLNCGVRRGVVSEKKLLDICPSPLNPTCFEIQGRYIREALENSLDSDFCLQDGKGPGFRGKNLGRLHVSNAVIEHDGRRIIAIYINDEELVDDKWYTVASSDYLQRGTGYTSFENNRNETYNKEFLRDTLREYMWRREFVERAFYDRWILK